MISRLILVLATALAMTPDDAGAESLGGVACPPIWIFGSVNANLRWAELWTGPEGVAHPIDGYNRDGSPWLEPRRGRPSDEIFWTMAELAKPAFLRCLYWASGAKEDEPEVIIPIPDDAAKCHRTSHKGDYRGHPTSYVDDMSCSPGRAQVPPPSVAEVIGPDTAMDGMRLRSTAQELAQTVRSRGGEWQDGPEPLTAHATFPSLGASYRIRFGTATGLAREITLIGADKSEASRIVFGAQRRFGTDSMLLWKGADNVAVRCVHCWLNPHIPPSSPPELRLLDRNDPDTLRENWQK